jgi:hypothetical protein
MTIEERHIIDLYPITFPASEAYIMTYEARTTLLEKIMLHIFLASSESKNTSITYYDIDMDEYLIKILRGLGYKVNIENNKITISWGESNV